MLHTRVGTGFDAHTFAEGRKLMLGGVEVPHDRGLAGHSDADVLLHAICDAILGALALGDIGKHFPPGEAKYKNIPSLELLKSVAGMAREKGYGIGNIDSTIIAENPKLSPYIGDMRKKIADALGAEIDTISVKATTTEGMGFAGRGEGIAAQAVAVMAELS
ncbi:MAG: 2-C-methyl-D-erythritol 2,4-cyclodiphosphate synthase [Nitrospinota bacterium]